MMVGANVIWERGAIGRFAVIGAAVASVVFQFVHVFYLSCFIADPAIAPCLFR